MPKNFFVQRLNKDFVVLGQTRVRGWYAWLIIGFIAGVAMGVGLVASRSGELEQLSAAVTLQSDSLESLTFDLLDAGEEIQAEAEKAGIPIEVITGDQTLNNEKNLTASAIAAITTPSSSLGASINKATVIAEKRQKLLEANVAENTDKVLKIALSTKLRNTFPKQVRTFIESEVTKTGEFEVLHIDHEDGTGDFAYSVKTNGQENLPLYFAQQKPEEVLAFKKDLKTGAKVKVKGLQVGEVLAADSADMNNLTVLQAAPLGNTLGVQKIIFMLVNFSNDKSQPTTASYIKSYMNSLETFYPNANYLKMSYGQTSFATDVVGWYTAPISNAGCPYSSVEFYGDQAAINAGVDLSQYSRRVYLFPHIDACQWGGLSTVGGNPSRADINGIQNFGTVIDHELGHSFGLYHSHSMSCAPAILSTSGCTVRDYGDIWDIMGGGGGPFNPFQKSRLGWLDYNVSPPITKVAQSGTYSLNDYQSIDALSKALKILRTGTTQAFWVQLLAPCDGCLEPGVYVRLATDGVGNSSFLLDMTPATEFWAGSKLDIGQTFTDPVSHASITTASISSDQKNATIQVSLSGTPPTCVRANPTLTLSPLGQFGKPGDTLSYTATIRNNDSSACAASSFTITPSGLPAGWSAPAKNISVPVGSQVNAPFTITSPINTSAGSYSFIVTAANTSDPAKTASQSAAYNIQPSFSYNLSSSGSMSVQRGNYASLPIKATLMSGTSQKISFAVSGLPSGTSAVFSSTSCTPTCQTNIKITATQGAATGTYPLVITGNPGAKTAVIILTVISIPTSTSVDRTPPTASIASPVNGGFVHAGNIVTIEVTASDNVAVTKVEVIVSGTRVCTITLAPYACGWKVPATIGRTYEIQARAYDARGNVGTSQVVRVKEE